KRLQQELQKLMGAFRVAENKMQDRTSPHDREIPPCTTARMPEPGQRRSSCREGRTRLWRSQKLIRHRWITEVINGHENRLSLLTSFEN
ncbi:hypothetical protein, partial [Endozoicomonas sp. SESOKO3]|uniref:hypothetical protein n=1 Tax=Endozoicomonas sp. SESOKO3 TaxID=2828744 RepID=UPI00214964EE